MNFDALKNNVEALFKFWGGINCTRFNWQLKSEYIVRKGLVSILIYNSNKHITTGNNFKIQLNQ